MNTLNATSETLAVHGGAACSSTSPSSANLFLGRDGKDGLAGGICQPVHNFSNECANGQRLVLVGIGGGVALPFWFVVPFHGNDL